MAGLDEGPEEDAPVKSKAKQKAEAPQEEKIDSVLHIDRSASPARPEWMKAPLHPELEQTGPAEYDLKSNMDMSFIKGQGDSDFTGLNAYEHIKSENLLEGCLSLADGLAIQERGAKAFTKFFEAKDSAVVTLWKSAFQDDDGKIYVPVAIPINGKVIISKGDLSIAWTKYRPLVRFK